MACPRLDDTRRVGLEIAHRGRGVANAIAGDATMGARADADIIDAFPDMDIVRRARSCAARMVRHLIGFKA